jgi:hypothetical protein
VATSTGGVAFEVTYARIVSAIKSLELLVVMEAGKFDEFANRAHVGILVESGRRQRRNT